MVELDVMLSRYSSLGRFWRDSASSFGVVRWEVAVFPGRIVFLGSVGWRGGCWQLLTVSRTWVIFQM